MRALARHIGRHIPGSPIVLPRNMPGAGSLVAANNIYNTAAKDGTVIGIFASSTLFSVKLCETKGNFEIDKFTWIGNMDQTIGTCVGSGRRVGQCATNGDIGQRVGADESCFGKNGITRCQSRIDDASRWPDQDPRTARRQSGDRSQGRGRRVCCKQPWTG